MSEVGKGVRLHRNASGEWEIEQSPGTIIGVEVGPERAVPGRGFAPIVPNDAWEPEVHDAPYWCVRRGGIIPRVHRPEHFVMFDLALPAYRRCSRCGVTIYTGVGRG